ncbi:MAG: sugar transferase [Proteobacteria bacterium]|nr:sugar transferase [Pseudomonadota bacterium]
MCKRGIDIVGSIVGILLFSPLFISIPVMIKFTSKGPVLFKQKRVGKFGKRFAFLKFRSMHMNNDDAVHRQYVKALIKSQKRANENEEDGKKKPVYKLTNDPRVTPIGEILRKTSMDELPQFFNVLFGEMSLVGPRPPISYELEDYDYWHRMRILEIKPGITGPWQVGGRSSTTFDEMVRLDLQYINGWSLWLDIKILLKTPWVVITGKGGH